MVIAVTNQKGGVGKTTISINLSCALALLGYRVLVIDMDPQGNSTDGLGVSLTEHSPTVYDILINETPISEVAVKHRLSNLFVVPADMSLFAAEAELSTEMSRPFKLRKAIRPEATKYDFILIDCPPNLGILTVNAILASTDLIVPIEPNSYALKGLRVLMNTLLKINSEMDHFPNFLGVAVNMFQPQNKLHTSIIQSVRDIFKDENIFNSYIERNPLIAEAEIYGESIIQYHTHNPATQMFINLAKEIVVKKHEQKEKRYRRAS